jgi:hypothetical protein
MPKPFETDWSNIDLGREGWRSLIDGMTFDGFLTEIDSCSFRNNKELVSAYFEKRLREIASEAREIFRMNVDNIIVHVNRDAIAEALEAEREAKDREVMDQILLDFHSNTRQWRPISQEKFDYMLECLPPIRMGRGGFINSEAWSSLHSGEEVYFVALKGNGICYATLGTVAEWDSKALDLMYDIEKW